MGRPLFLITNDDGISSGGLRAAAEAICDLGEVLIVAPKTEQTAMGRSFPRFKDQGIIETLHGNLNGHTVLYHTVCGSPAQAVAHAVHEIATHLPTLCISGINNGENLGGTNLISGTVGAALEAASYGIPAIAISIGPENQELFARPYIYEDWMVAMNILRRFAMITLDCGLPSTVALLNINIPASAKLDTDIRVTTQSRQSQYMCTRPETRDFSTPLRLPIKEMIDFSTLEPESDIFAFFVDEVVSVTPMDCDLTVRDSGGRPVQVFTKDETIFKDRDN